jgi:hypothetical protein
LPTPAPPEPSATPDVLPAPPSAADPLVELRLLLDAGSADGRIRKDGRELLRELDEFERELARDHQKPAADHLMRLRDKLNEGARAETIDADLAQQALALIDSIAQTRSINLPEPREPQPRDDKPKPKKDDKDH